MSDVSREDVTLLIAIVALLISVLSAGWQFLAWWLNEPHVALHISWEDSFTDSIPLPVVRVRAINSGRSAIQVASWSIGFDEGGGLSFPVEEDGLIHTPGTLDARHTIVWEIPVAKMDSFGHVADLGPGEELEISFFVVAVLGDGAKVNSGSLLATVTDAEPAVPAEGDATFEETETAFAKLGAAFGAEDLFKVSRSVTVWPRK